MKHVVSGIIVCALLALFIVGSSFSPGLYTLALVFGLLYAFKWMTFAYHPFVAMQEIRHPLIYLLLWVGMDPKPFTIDQIRFRLPNFWHLFSACINLIVAMLLLTSAVWMDTFPQFVRLWMAAFGFAFVFHFGLFKLNAIFIRMLGFDVDPIMANPVGTKSVTEFWGGRWNMAFKQLVFPFLYRPLTERFGRNIGVLATFLFSGFVHELVLSLPARGGWGLPTLYFLIQALALWLERRYLFKYLNGFMLRVFAYLMILLPAPLLFHTPFMERVIATMVVEFFKAVNYVF